MQISIRISGKGHPDDVAVECYDIRRRDDVEWPWWIENFLGEGMSITEQDLFDALDAHFKKQF